MLFMQLKNGIVVEWNRWNRWNRRNRGDRGDRGKKEYPINIFNSNGEIQRCLCCENDAGT